MKYNQLLTEKLNAEDAIKAEWKADKQKTISEWQEKLGNCVDKVRAEE